MSRRSSRLKAAKDPEPEELEVKPRRLERQQNVEKRSTSVPVERRRALSSASRESEGETSLRIPATEGQVEGEPVQLVSAGCDPKVSSDNFETDDSIEWDSSYDKCSPLKDVSDLLDLTISRVAEEASKIRSESVAVNIAPPEFAIKDSNSNSRDPNLDEYSAVLPIPSLLSVPGLAAVLETSEEELDEIREVKVSSLSNEIGQEEGDEAGEQAEEAELLRRLQNLRGSASMDEAHYKERVKALRKKELMIEVMLEEFTPDHVTYEDRESYKERLVKIGEKYVTWREDVTNLIAELDPDDETDNARVDQLKARRSSIVKLVADHAKNVKQKVCDIVSAHTSDNAPPAHHSSAAPSRGGGETAKKEKDLATKMRRKVERLETRSKELITKIGKLPEPSNMPERDLRREISVEFQERDKEFEKISEAAFEALDSLATVDDLNLRDTESEVRLNNLVSEVKDEVETRKALVRSLDKSLGLCTEYPNPSKGTVPVPDMFEGKVGNNVYKFKEKVLEYVDAAQIREKDKVETLRKYLSGEAKARVGEHFKNIDDAFKCLIDNFGNPAVIWAECKKELVKKVGGDFNSSWGRFGSQLRVSAIGKCLEFLREAEEMAKDYPELVNEVYSLSTFELLTHVLPYEYNSRICDEIGNVRTSQKEKMLVIQDYLELKQQGALVAAANDSHSGSSTAHLRTGLYGGSRDVNDHSKGGGGRGRGDVGGRRGKGLGGGRDDGKQGYHDCAKDNRCKSAWGLFGCRELYACNTVSERREYMRKRQGCWKCGDFPCKGFRSHKCNWKDKDAVRCIEQNCNRAAVMCEESHTPKVSTELKEWIKKNNIKTTVYVAVHHSKIMVSGGLTGYVSGKISDEEIEDLQTGHRAKNMPDSELADYFKKSLVKKGVSKPIVTPYPTGQCVFLFCLIEGKNRPIQAFLDSGCNTMLSRQGVPETELVSAKLLKGPIPISVAGGGEIFASGLWATLLPMNDGSNQVAKTLTMDTVTADMNVVDLECVYEDIKSKSKGVKALQNIKVPKEVGGKIDLLIGYNLLAVHPEPVHTFPSGLTVYKSRFKPPWPGVLGCVGGPVEALQCIAGMSGNIAALASLKHMASITKDYSPRLDFYPDMADNTPDDPELKFLGLVEHKLNELDQDDSEEECELSGHTAVSVTRLENEEDENIAGDHAGTGVERKNSRDEDVCEECFYSTVVYSEPCSLCSTMNQSTTVKQDLRKFMEYQEAGLDQGYKCPNCRKCKQCKRGAGYERISMKQEAEQEIIRESVTLNEDKNRAVVKLAFIADPAVNLKPNRFAALRRLDNVCKKYANEPEAIKMICDKVAKLHRTGHVKYMEDLSVSQKQKIEESPTSHYLCWDVGFKEDSLSTPARPVFDGSARTPGGTSLNEILAKGITTLARLVELQLAWVMGKFAMTGDVSQAYNSMQLDEEHWIYQRVLLKDGLEVTNKAREAIIISAIYGVRCVGGQLEVLCHMLADLVEEEYPAVAEFLRKFRYVDDFTKSTDTLGELLKLINDTEKVLAKASLQVKEWAWTGEDPPEKMSSDGSSICLAGLIWYTKIDVYRLNLDSIHFAVKKRGRYPPGTIKWENTKKSMNQFVPEHLTRRDCSRLAARVYDLRGDVAPLLLRLKYDLRTLIMKNYDWDDVIDTENRQRWIMNFTMIEEVRKFMLSRGKIPKDAVRNKGRLWILVDAAEGGLIMAAFVCFLRKNGTYSCQRVFAKGLLCPELWTIPARELQALAIGADTATFLGNTLADWVDREEIYVGSDSRIALAWVVYEKVKLDVYYRNRVSQIRSQVEMTRLFHVDGKQNIADTGTRPDDLKVEDFCPGSEWEHGKQWMKLEVEEAVEKNIIKPVEKIKLEDEEKKVFRKGITYEDFSTNPMIIALSAKHKIDKTKVQQRAQFSNYIYDPLSRSFGSVVRITALVLKAVKIFKMKRIVKLIKKEKCDETELEKFEITPIKFSIFYASMSAPEQKPDQKEKIKNETKTHFFNSNCGKLSDLGIILTEEDIDTALTYLYGKATKEIYEFVPKKIIDKEGIESDGILFAKTRILEEQELRVMGELDEMLNMEDFTGVKFKVPLIEKHSPLAVCIAFHMHYRVAPHKGSESVYRVSLQHAKILGGKSLYTAVEEDCIRCKILKKRCLEQMMGPLADSQLYISPVFYCSLLDMWGPVRTYCPGYERTGYTRGTVSHAKHYEVYYLVAACVVTGAVNIQVIEKKTTGAVLDGLSRFFNECSVPKILLPDADGAMMEALRDGVIEISDLEGTLSVDYGITFETCLPQGHWEHGRVERRIRMLQESLDRSGMKGTRCHATGLQTIAKAIERQVNDVPLGLLEQPTRGGNILRILSPNMLKLNTRTNRAPKGLLTIPNQAADLTMNVQKIFNLWYQVWNDAYLPMAAQYKKWLYQEENVCVGDIVLFKIKDSVFHSDWKIGKVDSIDVGRDNLVRGVSISYKVVSMDKEEPRHMVVQRPVKQIVKLFHITDTSLLSDITKVRKLTKEIISKKNKVPGIERDKTVPEITVPNLKETEIAPELTETKPVNVKQEEIVQDDPEIEIDIKTEAKPEDLDFTEIKDEIDSIASMEETTSEPNLKEILSDEDDIIDTQSNSEDIEVSEPISEIEESEEDQVDDKLTLGENKKKKSEFEKLLIENDKFWKNFDERNKRGTVSDTPEDLDGKKLATIAYIQLQCREMESDGAVFLL